ncbi:MAG: glycosyltransferase family 4 protein [Candidatus Omnitrophica bacterium]|nr:glycosyltransferase family 4 protein [Candidatus Omnitrophota bacterium]
MKINVLLNIGKKPSGASRPIIEFCNVLAKTNDVLIYKAFNPNKKGIEYLLREAVGFVIKGKNFTPGWIKSDCAITIIPTYKERFIRDADIVFFRSAHLIQEISQWQESKGIKVMRVSNVHMLKNPVKISKNIVLIASSKMVYEKLKILYPENRIFKVGNGVNCNFFSYEERKHETPRSVGMILYTGNDGRHKGTELGFELFNRIKQNFPDIRFLVVGLKKDKRLPKFVEFINGEKSHDILRFYRDVDIFIYPSYEDAWPNPPMEAMACGCAVVTTDVGGVREFAIDGKNAIICNPGDLEQMVYAVKSLIENPEYWKNIIDRAAKDIKQFDYAIQANLLEEVFHEILSCC